MSLNDLIKNAMRDVRETPPKLLALYAVVYFVWGTCMDRIGMWAEIAMFKYWWQVLTVYVLYLAPISIAARKENWRMQYLIGLLALAPIELVGYRLGSSIAFDNNILDVVLGSRNFTLAMTVFFGTYIPLGNWAVGTVAEKIGISQAGRVTAKVVTHDFRSQKAAVTRAQR